MRKRRMRMKVISLLTLIAAAAALTACGSASSGGAAAGGAAAGGSEWVIGNIGTYSGPDASAYALAGEVVQAWADSVNASGGIDGHHVKVVVMNDALSAATALSEVKELIQQDHVLAIVGEAGSTATVWAPYAEQQGVPVIGGDSIDPVFYKYPTFYPVGGTSDRSLNALVAATHQAHPRGGFVYCEEDPACSALIPDFKTAYALAGGTLVASEPVSVTAPDYTAQCLSLKNAGVQSVFIAAPQTTILTFARNCATQHYYPIVLANGVVVSPDQVTQYAAISGAKMLVSMDDFPFFDTSTAAEQAFHNALAKYAPAVLAPGNISEQDATAWASAELFEAAAKQAKLGSSPTWSQLKAGLYALHGATLDGLAPPLTFNSGQPTSISCIFVATVSGGKLVVTQDPQPYCPSN
jgi:branched-chain amino acid transport system substrate-binding protein